MTSGLAGFPNLIALDFHQDARLGPRVSIGIAITMGAVTVFAVTKMNVPDPWFWAPISIVGLSFTYLVFRRLADMSIFARAATPVLGRSSDIVLTDPNTETALEHNSPPTQPQIPIVQPQPHLDVPAVVQGGDLAGLSWDAEASRRTTLSILSPRATSIVFEVQAKGHREVSDLEIGFHRVTLNADYDIAQGLTQTVSTHRTIEVVERKPKLETNSPNSVALGDRIEVRWHARDANRVDLERDGNRRHAKLSDTWVFEADKCGTITLLLHATGKGGSVSREICIDVRAPEIEWKCHAFVRAKFAEKIAIKYSAEGATALTLKFLDEDAREERIAIKGTIEFPGIEKDQRLELVATAYDGAIESRTIVINVMSLRETVEHLLKIGAFNEQI